MSSAPLPRPGKWMCTMADRSNLHARTHAYTGRTPRALTVEQVVSARLDAAAGRSVQDIAAELDMAYDIVWRAVRGQTWPELTDPPPVPKYQQRPRPTNSGRTCCNCGITVLAEDCRIGRCGACYMYWRHHHVERPARLWGGDDAPGIDRTGWVHCRRCTILIPQAGLCDYCERRMADASYS